MDIRDIRTVRVEHWLRQLRQADGESLADTTKAKIRNLMSVLLNHAIRYEWLEQGKSPITLVRQSTKRKLIPEVLEPGEIQGLLRQLDSCFRVMVMLDATTGLRRGELHRASRRHWASTWLPTCGSGRNRAITAIANGENVKVVQELMRHASSRCTPEVYVSGGELVVEHQSSLRLGMPGDLAQQWHMQDSLATGNDYLRRLYSEAGSCTQNFPPLISMVVPVM
jgi:hypothetical protein